MARFVASMILLVSYQWIESTLSQSLFAVSDPTNLLDWAEANILCDTSTPRGQLVSSHYESDDHIINTLCNNQSIPSTSCWIGLYRFAYHSEWQWIDNTSTDHNFNNNNPSDPIFHTIVPTHSQSCVSITTHDNNPKWSDSNCLTRLEGAVCSTCGSLNEYCCHEDNKCNNDNLQCMDNRCIEYTEPTSFYSTVINDNDNDNDSESEQEEQEEQETNEYISLIAIILVVIFIIAVNVAIYIYRRRKSKLFEKSYHAHHNLNSRMPDNQV